MRSGRVVRTSDMDIFQVTDPQISAYLAWLRTEYQPHRFGAKTHPLSPKTLRNVWLALSSFFRWGQQELTIIYPISDIRVPRTLMPTFLTLMHEEAERMLKTGL